MQYKKKLIEVALPLEAINTQSAREKSIRHGHPSTLHLWWARRPLAAARAVIWASLVDDPSSLPEQFPTEEEQNAERKRLFDILTELVKWENSNNQTVLDAAKAEIMKSTDNNPPALLDPFAGGGAIPLEAQRLGLEAHASDLNPVAVMINKAMIEIPPKFAGQPPVNPDAKQRNDYNSEWRGATGLAEDVRYYGEWMKKKAFERIGHLYPKVKDEHGREHTVIAWIWARTVKCQNPACGCEMPLVSSFVLSKKKGKEAYIQPIIEGRTIRYEVKLGKDAPEPPKTARGRFKCIFCESHVDSDYIKTEGKAKRMDATLMAVIAEGQREKLYLSPSSEHSSALTSQAPKWLPSGEIPARLTGGNCVPYGLEKWSDLFTNRQLVALTTFNDLVAEVLVQAEIDGATREYAQDVAVYLMFAINKLADNNSSIVSWNINRDGLRNTFSRQAIPMSWDYAEANPFSNSAGCFDNSVDWVARCLGVLGNERKGFARQHDAQSDNGLRHIIISTDPPYYDNIAYADLSDFFYVWLRKALKGAFPDIFKTMFVPKSEELVATPYRFDGSREKANLFFETGMLQAFKQIYLSAREDVPVTVYYAYKQSASDENDNTASTGWETMLSAIIQAGFSITGTWPMRTEREVRTVASGTNALASSIVLVCRKRSVDAPTTSRRAFINELRTVFADKKDGLAVLLSGNISPVDLPQSSIGPGMAVYSKYVEVLEADGTPMSIRDALVLINQELDAFLAQQEGRMDAESRFCIGWFEQFGLTAGKYGDADTMARARLANLQALVDDGVLESGRNIVRLKRRDELPEKWNSGKENTIWTIVQQLCRCFETLGLDETAAHMLRLSAFDTSKIENAKNLAYRAYIVAERKGWADEAFAYNSLVTAWPDLITRMNKLKDATPEQMQIEI